MFTFLNLIFLNFTGLHLCPNINIFTLDLRFGGVGDLGFAFSLSSSPSRLPAPIDRSSPHFPRSLRLLFLSAFSRKNLIAKRDWLPPSWPLSFNLLAPLSPVFKRELIRARRAIVMPPPLHIWRCNAHGKLCTVCTVYTGRMSQYTVHMAQYTWQCTQGTVHTVQCTRYIAHSRSLTPIKWAYSRSPDCLLKLDLSGGPCYLQTPHFACVVTSPPKGSIDYRL